MQVEKFKETLDLYINILNETAKSPLCKCDFVVMYHLELEGDMSILKGYNLLFAPVKDGEIFMMLKNDFEGVITFKPYIPEYVKVEEYTNAFGRCFPTQPTMTFPPAIIGE